MRILRLLDTTNRGGSEIQALDICRNAARFGLEYTLVAAGGGALNGQFSSSGVEFIRLQRHLPIDLLLVAQLRRIIIKRSIQIVHGHQAVESIHLYLASLGLNDVRHVLNFDGFVPDGKNRRTLKYLIPRMDANVAVGHALRKWLAEKDGLDTKTNFHVIHTGPDPMRLVPSAEPRPEQLGIEKDEILLGMVGSFYRDPRKDQLTICRALPKVFAAFPKAHCIFSGGVEKGAEHKIAACRTFCDDHGISPRVHFLGADSSVPDILAALDLFVFSSLHEGMPLAVSEAMLAGVPLIVSDIEPLLEATEKGTYAEVFPTGDAEILAEKIISLLGDDERRKQLAEKTRVYANENLSIDAHLGNLKKLYESIV